ncbi:sigma-54-dependent transcriptional regulator [Polyangium mundeleinium]|uniref:Sigma-54 dependent transcriptional regulator n=1 Tax=Polyangium mundeleinium TaxID=2995306 RepID=A0ABT5ER66_9BACT|nr:sigma-54 dependent transcriptional regulator [Polyangium mundeleinium]MDC0743688.1 sigma-54 dependent transcriptional regulator [Polyangium mundeleinium]
MLRAHRAAGHHTGRVLLVEDEPDQAAILEAVLRHEGLDVLVASSGEQALEIQHRTPADVLVTDLNLPGMTGMDLMRRLTPPTEDEAIKTTTPAPAVVVVTGSGSVSSAVDALKLGAADYLQKPLDPARLVSLVRELLSSDNVREAEGEDDDAAAGPLVFEGMVGGSRGMREVFARIDRVASTMAPVLIVGESGTGKELVARAIHNRSPRKNGPFIPVHTGAIPRELIGSELFGHEKGSFTGAFSSAEGKFEAATGGTVFLDEVGTMDSAVQVSLLRVLETYRFTRVGGRKEIEADVRIVAATNKDLLDLVDENVFREDLYYRLNVFTITLPPLRERVEDILPIAERFLVKFAKRYGTPARRFSEGAIQRLYGHDWPGNVRELRNVVEQTALFAAGEIVAPEEVQIGQGRIERRTGRRSHHDLQVHANPPHAEPEHHVPTAPITTTPPPAIAELEGREPPPSLTEPPPPSASASFAQAPIRATTPSSHDLEAREGGDRSEHPLVLRLPVGTRLADAERKLILLTLEAVRGNKQRAARVLGISRRGLYSKLQAYGEHVGSHEAPEAQEAQEAESPQDSAEEAPPPASEEAPSVPSAAGDLDAGRCLS